MGIATGEEILDGTTVVGTIHDRILETGTETAPVNMEGEMIEGMTEEIEIGIEIETEIGIETVTGRDRTATETATGIDADEGADQEIVDRLPNQTIIAGGGSSRKRWKPERLSLLASSD